MGETRNLRASPPTARTLWAARRRPAADQFCLPTKNYPFRKSPDVKTRASTLEIAGNKIDRNQKKELEGSGIYPSISPSIFFFKFARGFPGVQPEGELRALDPMVMPPPLPRTDSKVNIWARGVAPRTNIPSLATSYS
jgi:hypothetical protein